MQPINFPGAIEIGKPASMTDEQCMSVFAAIISNENNIVTHYTTLWKPSFEDLQALNRGEGIYVQVLSNRLPPMALYTVNEKGECNDAG